MSKQLQLANSLVPFLPLEAIPKIVEWIDEHKIILTITEKRSSVFGDYRRPRENKGHQISVNGDLNRFAFLVTFVHEMAHLTAWLKHGDKKNPHGTEWKNEFKRLMLPFFTLQIFPADLEMALAKYLGNPSSSSCFDESLMRALKKFDKSSLPFVLDLQVNETFQLDDGRIFKRGEKIRKRIRCVEVSTNKIYLFNPIAEVKRV